MEAQAVATRLMVELTRRDARRGTIDVGGAGPARRSVCTCARRGSSGCSARRSPRAEQARDPRGARLRGRRRRRRARRHRSRTSAAATSPARSTSSRRSRASTASRSCPATLPSRRGAVGVLAPEQRLRRRAEDALVGAGLYEVVGWSFTSPDAAQARLRRRPRARAAEEPDERGAGGHAHARARLAARRAPRQTPARDAATCGCSRSAPSTCRDRARPAAGTARARRRALGRRALPDERTHVGALLTGPAAARRRGATRRRRRPTSSPPRACSRRWRARCASSWPSSRRAEPFLHPGRAARVLAGGEPAGWVGELHPRAARGTSSASPPSRSTSRVLQRAARRARSTAT